MQDEALHVYWSVFTVEQRASYEVAKATLMSWQGQTIHGYIGRLVNPRKKFTDTPPQVFQESASIVKLLGSGTETKEELAFNVAMARSLAT